ncbi:MAG: hypothetical protein IKD40_05735 [Bacteroidaceae bacterium]|nr:hypothetical protein [Bacteroidaceae bacterium]
MRTDIILNKVIGENKRANIIDIFYIALKEQFPEQHHEAIYAVSTICSLYISHFRCGFPVMKMRTFNTNIRQEVELPIFDCKIYSSILSSIPEERLINIELYNANCTIEERTLKKQDIIEALDFYTNQ